LKPRELDSMPGQTKIVWMITAFLTLSLVIFPQGLIPIYKGEEWRLNVKGFGLGERGFRFIELETKRKEGTSKSRVGNAASGKLFIKRGTRH